MSILDIKHWAGELICREWGW